MTLTLTPPEQPPELKPRIIVFGVGGAGGNAVNNMIRSNLEGVECVVANTDAQALNQCLAERKIQLGLGLTQGLGAGSRPEVGRAAAEEGMEEIISQISGGHMVFVTAGMGGGTGTGAAPVIAGAAREQGLLTVGVVTKPFHFEGSHRMELADQGIEELTKVVDTLIVIPNQNLFRVANEKTTFTDAFQMADEVLYAGVRGVTELMISPGLINLDFADIRAIMDDGGKAMMGSGEADGESRALAAAEAAIANPLLEDSSLAGARGCLINITGGPDLTLYEVDEAANRIRDEVDPAANIIFGSVMDEALEGRMRVSIFATGVDGDASSAALRPPSRRAKAVATADTEAAEATGRDGDGPTDAPADVGLADAAMPAPDSDAMLRSAPDGVAAATSSFKVDLDQDTAADDGAPDYLTSLDDHGEPDEPAGGMTGRRDTDPPGADPDAIDPHGADPIRISPAASRLGDPETAVRGDPALDIRRTPAQDDSPVEAQDAESGDSDESAHPPATGSATRSAKRTAAAGDPSELPEEETPGWPAPEAGQPDMFAERSARASTPPSTPPSAAFGDDPDQPASDLPDAAVRSNRGLRQALMADEPEPSIIEGPDNIDPPQVLREPSSPAPAARKEPKRSLLSRLVGRSSNDTDEAAPAATPAPANTDDETPRFGAQLGRTQRDEDSNSRTRRILADLDDAENGSDGGTASVPEPAPARRPAETPAQTIVLDRNRPAGDGASRRGAASFVPPELEADRGNSTSQRHRGAEKVRTEKAGGENARSDREPASASDEDMLEIPAFLRRQSN